MLSIHPEHIIVQSVQLPLFAEKELQVAVLRTDLLHPVVSGNKWFKLQPYLEKARASGKKRIVTFGGAWSNHIVATAAAAQAFGFSSAGIIRGEAAATPSATLMQAHNFGMELFFSSRSDYAAKKLPFTLQSTDLLIPEGGFGTQGAAGAGTMASLIANKQAQLVCAVGTGTMMAGLINAGFDVTGILVLKDDAHQMEQQVRGLLNNTATQLSIQYDFHWGGYAKWRPELITAMNSWYQATGIPSDFVYTGKLFYAVQQLAKNNFFRPGSSIICIHSGGLQGNISLPKGTLIF